MPKKKSSYLGRVKGCDKLIHSYTALQSCVSTERCAHLYICIYQCGTHIILNPINVTPAHGSNLKMWSLMIDVLFQWWRYEYKTRYSS